MVLPMTLFLSPLSLSARLVVPYAASASWMMRPPLAGPSGPGKPPVSQNRPHLDSLLRGTRPGRRRCHSWCLKIVQLLYVFVFPLRIMYELNSCKVGLRPACVSGG